MKGIQIINKLYCQFLLKDILSSLWIWFPDFPLGYWFFLGDDRGRSRSQLWHSFLYFRSNLAITSSDHHDNNKISVDKYFLKHVGTRNTKADAASALWQRHILKTCIKNSVEDGLWCKIKGSHSMMMKTNDFRDMTLSKSLVPLPWKLRQQHGVMFQKTC
jgi:hypothetical protein